MRAQSWLASSMGGVPGRSAAQVTQHKSLCSGSPTLQRLIEMRAPFLDPLNVLQARPQQL